MPDCNCIDGTYDDGSTEDCLDCDYKCLTCETTADTCNTCSGNRINAPECGCDVDNGYYNVDGVADCAPCH